MEIAQIDVSGVRARAIVYRPIPVGMIGGTVRFVFSDPQWDGLTKTVVFQAGDVTKDVVNPGELVTIPPEITRQQRRNVLVGVYGTDAQKNLVIPTLWASIGMVRDATSPSGDSSTDESLPVWAQLRDMIGNLEDLDTEAKDNLVEAINQKGVWYPSVGDDGFLRWTLSRSKEEPEPYDLKGKIASGMTEEELLELLAEMDCVQHVASASGEIYTSNSGEIYIL